MQCLLCICLSPFIFTAIYKGFFFPSLFCRLWEKTLWIFRWSLPNLPKGSDRRRYIQGRCWRLFASGWSFKVLLLSWKLKVVCGLWWTLYILESRERILWLEHFVAHTTRETPLRHSYLGCIQRWTERQIIYIYTYIDTHNMIVFKIPLQYGYYWTSFRPG